MCYDWIKDNDDYTHDLGCRICKKVMISHAKLNDPRYKDEPKHGMCPRCHAISEFADECYDKYNKNYRDLKLMSGIYNFRDTIKRHLYSNGKISLGLWVKRDMELLRITIPEQYLIEPPREEE